MLINNVVECTTRFKVLHLYEKEFCSIQIVCIYYHSWIPYFFWKIDIYKQKQQKQHREPYQDKLEIWESFCVDCFTIPLSKLQRLLPPPSPPSSWYRRRLSWSPGTTRILLGPLWQDSGSSIVTSRGPTFLGIRSLSWSRQARCHIRSKILTIKVINQYKLIFAFNCQFLSLAAFYYDRMVMWALKFIPTMPFML